MNLTKKLPIGLAIAAFILFYNAATFANTVQQHYPIGELLALQGKAFTIGEFGKRVINEGDPIYMNTKLETGAEARALILFVDNTEITLGSNAEFEIDEYVFDPYDVAENKGHFSIKGAFAWTSGLISKRPDPDVAIKTRVGSIGIRGTQFWGGTLDDHYCVYVFDGLVNYSTQSKTIALNPDQGVVTKDETSTFNTESWDRDKINMAKQTIAFKNENALKPMLKQARIDNVAKQHDYRSRMFPYKENPLRPKLKVQEDEFFSEEFEELRNR